MKIVINSDYGGFGLSDEAMLLYAKLMKMKLYVDKSASKWCTMFYTVPVAEYKKKHAIAKKTGEWENCNGLCFRDDDIKRDDPVLVKVVEKLGVKANGHHAHLKVVEIPDGMEWEIAEYDGNEHVAERHRKFW